MGKYTVYMHKFPNGKVYIGVTRQELSRRWREGKGYIGQPVYDAIVKYGWSNIEHIVLESGLKKEEAEAAEKAYIKKYNSLSHDNGYNIETGGYLTESMNEETRAKLSAVKKGQMAGAKHWHYGQHWDEKTRAKMSMAAKNRRKPTETERKRMSERFSGKNNPMYGTKMSPEHREKLMAASKRAHSKPVICVETGIEYPNSVEANKQTGICSRTINYVCNKHPRFKTAGGYHWMFKSEVV